MAEFDLPGALKGQHWEIAKGHLRALVNMQGSYMSGSHDDTPETLRWEQLEERVAQFIEDVEGNGLHE